MYALIDCNNFFVSCERIFRPDLEGRPVVVLSNNDGCFVSRSQEAKDLGIPMGAPLFRHKQTVKNNRIELFSANFELYGDISERIVTLLREETPLIEVYSIDECFLDLSQLDISSYVGWAERVKDRIKREIGVPVSVGVAPTKTLSKVASTFAKKHGGVYVVDDEITREKLLRSLPIEDIWGIGWRMAPKLRDKGISNAWQLVSASDGWLGQQFNITGMKMVNELRGSANIPFGDKHDTRKTIMRSRSFGHKIRAYNQLESAVATFAAQAAVRLRAQNCLVRQVNVFLSANRHAKDQARVYLSTTMTMDEVNDDTAKIITCALEGLEAIYDDQFAYQKAGITLLDIKTPQQWQISMLSQEVRRDERQELMRSIDDINNRYGKVIYHAAERSKENLWRSKQELRSPKYTTSWAELPVL